MAIEQAKRNLWSTYASIVAVGTLSWCGCGGEPTPITSQTSKYEVADENPSVPTGSSSTSQSADNITPPADLSPRPIRTAETSEAPSSPRPQGLAGNSSPATPSADPSGAPTKPSSQPPKSSEPAPTAADGPQKLLAHIEKLQNQDPRAATREESLSNLVKIQREIVETANLILTSKSDEEMLVRAAEAKVGALSLLSQLQKEAQAEMSGFVAELKKSPHAKLARLARRMEFAQQMDALANGQTTDASKLIAQFKQMFEEEEKDESLFRLSQQVTDIFLKSRHSNEAAEIMKLVADTFSGHSNANLVKAAKMMREQLVVVELHLEEKFGAVFEDKPKADEELLAAMDKLFADRELGEMTLQMVSQMAQMVESKNLDLADKMYAKLVAAYSKQSTPELAKAAQDMAANLSKRKAIIGQTFVVEGVTLDGQPFDWSKYQGKVVLVDFWATWCQPCLAEIPNIKQNYDRYHEQGFEVVGINLDEDPGTVQQFFARQRLPWPTVLSPDPKSLGFQHPLAVKCGVEAIPFLVLVDRNGKAIALNVRGEALGKELATLFTSSDQPGTPSSNPLRKTPEKKTEVKTK